MTTLKSVPEALALGTAQMCVDAINGTKEISVRTNHRAYTTGNTLVLYNEEFGFVATATISSVRLCKLAEVNEQEWQADGFESQEDLLAVLRGFYGDSITLDSDVTVLRWKDVTGVQVESYREDASAQATN